VDLAGLKVLVVDDNETHRSVLENMLGAWGMLVTLAVDGQDAFEQLLACPPNEPAFVLALVDMQMPRMDGLHLAAALREAGLLPGLRMVMLSSASSADDARAAREAGFQRFVAKPVRRAELRRAIQGVAAAQREPVESDPALDCDVLVVEDNGVNRQVIDQMLKGLGCRPQLASGAMEGLRALCEKRFDLVLMDIQMPGMDGIEALRCFRRGPGNRFAFVTPPDTPVIAVTANALAEDETRLRALGFDDYLSKPFRRGQLLAMLNHHLIPGAPSLPSDAGAPPPAEAAAGAGASSGAGSTAPSSDVLDAAALDRLRELDPKGENQLLQRVLTAFQTSIARLVPQVQAASANGDLAGVRHVAHTLKSSSASIGAVKLAQLCGEIESMIRLEKVDSLAPRVAAMCAEIDTVLQALKQLLDDKP
jgi:CheY-like chemotaxis protein